MQDASPYKERVNSSMERKAWLRRRKSREKTITANKKFDPSFVGSEQEKEKVLELERSLEELNVQISYMRIESNAKDDLLAKQVTVVEESIAGIEKAKTEAESFKKELADALHQKEAAEKKMLRMDIALKECMQQLCALKEEHQHTTNDAATTISRVQENAQVMEKILAEANKNLSKLAVENSNLSRILEVKEKLIQDLTERKSQIESSFAQLDKESISLKYEVCILQRELEIRNHDTDFHIKSADAAHKKYLESLKKITKLESECQKLRVMVRKRLPGPAAIAKMRSEVEILGNNTFDTTRKSPIRASVNDYDSSSKKVASLMERQRAIEDENKILKETVVKTNNELQLLRVMFAQTATKLSQTEPQVKEFSKGQNYLALISQEGRDEDTVNCSEAWASVLISELEHFKNGKAIAPSSTTAGASELDLMDDFIEMEKLAIVCVDKQSESSNINTGDLMPPVSPEGIATGKEIVLVNTLSNQILSLSDSEKTLCKIIEVIEGIIQKSFTNNNDQQILAGKDESTSRHDTSFSPTKHVARLFIWEKSELCAVLQQFIVVCNDLLHGKADLKKFICDLALTLEWIIKHCFPIQDLTTTEETIKNLFDGDYELERKLKEENKRLISEIRELESKNKELEQWFQSASAKNELLSTQLKESDARLFKLDAELVTLKCSDGLLEDQIENEKLIAEELGTQLTVANAELCESRKKLYSLEVELEDKCNSCEELEATCLELQLQLASVATKDDKGQEEKQLRTDWEISAASEKLAECQATILNLGKQLKALASPKDAVLFDKVISPPSATKINKLSQLLDQAQDEEDEATKEIICTEIKQPPLLATSDNNPNAGVLYGRTLGANAPHGADVATKSIDRPQSVNSYELNKRKGEKDVVKLVLVPKKPKGGVSFLKKLLLRRKKESNKNKALPIAS